MLRPSLFTRDSSLWMPRRALPVRICPRCRRPIRRTPPRPLTRWRRPGMRWPGRVLGPLMMAAGDELLGTDGSEKLDASGSEMVSDAAGDHCCCGGCTCATLSSTFCPQCGACTPAYALLVFSGVSTFCVDDASPPFLPAFNWYDAAGATIAYSTIIPGGGVGGGAPCVWSNTVGWASAYNTRRFTSGSSSGSATCGGTLAGEHFDVTTEVHLGGSPSLLTVVSQSDTQYAAFAARVFYSGACSGSIVIPNGQDVLADPSTFPPLFGGSGGTCTLTWCP